MADNKRGSSKKKKIAVWKLVVIDIAMLSVSMSIFMLFDYVLPNAQSNGEVVTDIASAEETNFNLPEGDSVSDNSKAKNNSDSDSKHGRGPGAKGGKPGDGKGGGRNTGNTNTESISSDTVSASKISSSDVSADLLESYSSDNVNIKINEKSVGSDSDKITYYVADIYVTNIKYLKTAFAEDTYGKNIKDTVDNMAAENNAVLSVNGDFYGNGEYGVVIRNGVLYRSNLNDADICVLFTDGTMKTYSPQEFNADEVISEGAWQAWTFGPALLDGSGKVLSSFNTTSYLNSENPRTAIGYVEPGHYVLVVVDGRSEGHSKGATLSELAQIMADEGCTTAYNLDGGKSSGMVFKGSYINEPVDGGREVSDIVYIAE